MRAWFTLFPAVVRYAISGLVGNIIFFFLNQHLSLVVFPEVLSRIAGDGSSVKAFVTTSLQRNIDSLSFFIAYLIQVVPQHLLNALLVFGADTIDSLGKYGQSLRNSYVTYFATLCGSTVVNALMLQYRVPRTVAFWGSIGSFAVVNYVLISAYESKLPLSPPPLHSKEHDEMEQVKDVLLEQSRAVEKQIEEIGLMSDIPISPLTSDDEFSASTGSTPLRDGFDRTSSRLALDDLPRGGHCDLHGRLPSGNGAQCYWPSIPPAVSQYEYDPRAGEWVLQKPGAQQAALQAAAEEVPMPPLERATPRNWGMRTRRRHCNSIEL